MQAKKSSSVKKKDNLLACMLNKMCIIFIILFLHLE